MSAGLLVSEVAQVSRRPRADSAAMSELPARARRLTRLNAARSVSTCEADRKGCS